MIKISFAKTEHIELISEFERDVFNSEAYSYDTLTEMMKDNYILKNNDNIFEAINNNELIGYIIFHISDDFTDIYKIFVREKNRKNGIGSLLLKEVETLAARYKSKKIMIEVRSNNKNAISFYNKNGLESIDIRKGYYKNPNDDAIICEKRLSC